MSELVQMRQRIKAIETIKKITHAMRLISMSSHSRLKKKHAILTEYITKIDALFFKIQESCPSWRDPIMHPEKLSDSPKLIILVGSQKGLCGNFNNLLFKTFAHHTNLADNQNVHIIAIGKRAIDLVINNAPNTLIATHDNFTARTLPTIANKVVDAITKTKKPYSLVTAWNNELKNFFTQKPLETKLIPLVKKLPTEQSEKKSAEEYIWQQDSHETLNIIAKQYIEAHIYHVLFESLLSEQAARFISMDSSTRNAQTLLETNKLAYNKARQAKITKELTELSGSF